MNIESKHTLTCAVEGVARNVEIGMAFLGEAAIIAGFTLYREFMPLPEGADSTKVRVKVVVEGGNNTRLENFGSDAIATLGLIGVTVE